VHTLTTPTGEPETLPALASVVPQRRGSLNLNRRSEILRLNEAGQSAGAIAENLGVPAGEVEFTLKIDRMLASAAQMQ
jgi:hypothetical protein